ncbi:MAG: NAD(P)/FAD-dependent oxidoreductase, partial [Dehalococcoidia bacterium]|nr:NAD(P)/FAD-dependent oxidoreductase [Dehalococcoidia bacterium]
MTTKNPQIAIVGAGLAGLSAAAAAGRAGATVTVYEATKAAGGRARTHAKDGYRFNLGPHALYPGAAAVLRDLGVEIPGSTPNVAGLAYAGGKLHRLPASAWTLLTTGLLNPLDKAEFVRVMSGLRNGEWHDRTVRDWVESVTGRETVRDLLFAVLRLATYINAPDDLSAGAALAQFASGTDVIYVDGGWQTLTRQLEAKVLEAGGMFVHGSHIEAVVARGGRVQVASHGRAETYDAVVVTGSPGGAKKVLGSAASAAVQRSAHDAVDARASVLDLGLDRLPRPRRRFGIGIDSPLYLSVHSGVARQLAPAGGATVNLARYVPAGEAVDPGVAEATLLDWADTAQPGWRDHEVTRRFFPELTVINAVPLARHGGLPGRPKSDESGLPGVFIAGDWVGPTGLIADCATASGVAAGEAAATW